MKSKIIRDTGVINRQMLNSGFRVRAEREGGQLDLVMLVRSLKTEDLQELLSLQTLVHDAIGGDEMFVYTSAEECTDSLEKDICIGAFADGQMIAAAILVSNRDSDRNVGKKMSYDPLRSVTLDSIFIEAEFRGMGLQNYMIGLMLDLAEELGADYSFATVSPENIYSLRNFESQGFSVIYRGMMYEGVERFVMMKQSDFLMQKGNTGHPHADRI